MKSDFGCRYRGNERYGHGCVGCGLGLLGYECLHPTEQYTGNLLECHNQCKGYIPNYVKIPIVSNICSHRGEMITFDCCSPNDYECLHPEVSRENGGVAEAGKCGEKCRGFIS